MSDNRELKLTVTVDDSNLKEFRQQLLDWKKEFPKDAKATSGRIMSAYEELAQSAIETKNSVKEMVTANSTALAKMQTSLDNVATAMAGVQTALKQFDGLGRKMTVINTAVESIKKTAGELGGELEGVQSKVKAAVEALPRQVSKAAREVKAEIRKLADEQVDIDVSVDTSQVGKLKQDLQNLAATQTATSQSLKKLEEDKTKTYLQATNARLKAKTALTKQEEAFQAVVEAEMADDDTTNLEKKYDRAKKSADAAAKQVKELEQAYAALEAKEAELNKVLADTAQKTNLVETELKQASTALTQVGNAAPEVQKATTEVSQLALAIDKLGDKLAGAGPNKWAKEAADSFNKYFGDAAQSIGQIRQPLETIKDVVVALDKRLDDLSKGRGAAGVKTDQETMIEGFKKLKKAVKGASLDIATDISEASDRAVSSINKVTDELRKLTRGFGIGNTEIFSFDLDRLERQVKAANSILARLGAQKEAADQRVQAAQNRANASLDTLNLTKQYIEDPKASAQSRKDAANQLPNDEKSLQAALIALDKANAEAEKLGKEYAQHEALLRKDIAAVNELQAKIKQAGSASVLIADGFQITAQETDKSTAEVSQLARAVSNLEAKLDASSPDTWAKETATAFQQHLGQATTLLKGLDSSLKEIAFSTNALDARIKNLGEGTSDNEFLKGLSGKLTLINFGVDELQKSLARDVPAAAALAAAGVKDVVEEIKRLNSGLGITQPAAPTAEYDKAEKRVEEFTAKVLKLQEQRKAAALEVARLEADTASYRNSVAKAENAIANPPPAGRGKLDPEGHLTKVKKRLAESEQELNKALEQSAKLESSYQKIEARLEESKASLAELGNKATEVGRATVRLADGFQAAAQEADKLEKSLDLTPVIAALSKIDQSISNLANTLDTQLSGFAKAGKNAGEAFGDGLEKGAKEGAAQAATAAQKILDANFVAKGQLAQVGETLRAQLAKQNGVAPEILQKKFSSFALNNDIGLTPEQIASRSPRAALNDGYDNLWQELKASSDKYLKNSEALSVKDAAANSKRIIRMQLNSAKLAEGFRLRTEKESYGWDALWDEVRGEATKYLANQEKLRVADEAANSKRIIRMQLNSAKLAEAFRLRAEKEAYGWDSLVDELNSEATKYLAAAEKARRDEEASTAKRIASLQTSSLKLAAAQDKRDTKFLGKTPVQQFNEVRSVLRAQKKGKNLDELYDAYNRLAVDIAQDKNLVKSLAIQSKNFAKESAAVAKTVEELEEHVARLNKAYALFGAVKRAAAVQSIADEIRGGAKPENLIPIYGSRAVEDAQNPATVKALNDELERSRSIKEKSVPSNAAFNKSLDDMKFAARGVASGFNAMWLTWGNLVPLLSGALISNAFVQATKQGADFAYQLDVISVLGQESADNVTKVKEAALALSAEGPFGPQQVAEAFKTLALAGVRAKDQIFAVRDVMNLALVGQLDLNQAAESLVGIATAFGFTVAGYTKVNDVIAKTAAESQASVQTITESMKQASTVAEQYAISVEDVGTAITSLAKRNITGSAAGTSIRNFYNEITGGSEKARKALEAIKFTAFEEGSGKIKDLVTLVKDFEKATAGFSNEKFLETMKTVFNERATKGFSALIADLRKTRQEGGETASVLEQTYQKIADSAGFAIISSAQLAQSTVNQMKGVKSALETSLVSVFDDLEPTILELSRSLKGLFNSDEFKQGIKSLVLTFADFAVKIYSIKDALFEAAKAYVAFKIISGTASVFSTIGLAATGAIGALRNFSLQSAITGAAAQAAGASAAAGVSSLAASNAAAVAGSAAAAGTAARGLGVAAARFVSFLGPIGAVVGTVASLMLLYKERSVEAITSSADAAKTRGKDILDQMDEEIARLQQQLALKRGINSESDFVSLIPVKTQQQFAADLAAADLEIEKNKGRGGLEMKAKAARTQLINDYAAQQSAFAAEAKARTEKIKAAQAELLKADQAAIQDALRKGPINPVDVDLNPKDETNKQRDVYRQLSALEEKNANREKEILDAKLKYKLVAEESYVQQLEKIKQEEAETLLKYNLEQFEEAPTKFKGEELQKQYELLIKQRQAVVDNIAAENQLAQIKFRGQENLDAIKLEKDLRTTSLQVTNELAKAQAEFNAVSVAPEVAAAQAARLKVEQDFSKILSERQTEQEKFQEELLILQQQEGEFDQRAADSLNAKIALKQVEIDKIKQTTEALAQQAEQQALNNELLKKDPVRNVKKAVEEYYAELGNLGTIAGNFAKQSLQKLEESFTEFLLTGKFSASKLFDYLKTEMASFLTKQYIMKPIKVLLEAVFTGGAGALGSLFGTAAKASEIAKFVSGGLDGSAGDGIGTDLGAVANSANSLKSLADLGSMLSKVPSLLSGGISGLETTIYNSFARAGANAGITGTSNIALSNAGVYASAGAIAYGGYKLGRGISNGYSLNGGTGNATVNAGAVIGGILGAAGGPIGIAIGSAIGSAIGGTVNRLFGRKTILGAAGIQGTLDSNGLSGASSFQDVTQKGGLFRSSKSYTVVTAIDQKAVDQVNEAFFDISRVVKTTSRVIGADFTKAISEFKLVGRLGSDFNAVLTNASDTLINKVIETTFGSVDVIKQQVGGTNFIANLFSQITGTNGISTVEQALSSAGQAFKDFLTSVKQESEKMIDVFVRVGAAIAEANRVSLTLGKSVEFSVYNAESAFSLVTALGDQGMSNLQTYAEKFLSEVEGKSRQVALFNESVRQLDLGGVINVNTTREQFKALVEAVDITNEAGQRELTSLLAIVPQLDALISAREAEVQSVIDAALAVNSAIESIFSSIDSEIERLKGELVTNQTSDQALAVFNATIAKAKAGDGEAIEKLPDVSRIYEQFVLDSAASAIDIARARSFLIESLQSVPRVLPNQPNPVQALSPANQPATSLDSAAGTQTAGAAPLPPASTSQALPIIQVTGDNNNAQLATALNALAVELRQLRTDTSAEQQAMATSLLKITRTLDRVAPDDAVTTRSVQ